ncbi:MAG: rod shape-determining protein MreC [Bermanella sp.]
MFSSGPTLGYRLLLAILLSVSLMLADRYLAPTAALRATLGYLIVPVQWVSSISGRLSLWAEESAMSHASLLEDNNRLRLESLVLKQKVQQTVALRTENNRLRELLNTSEQLDDKILVAELIGVDPDPYTHHIIINKGASHNVFVGQPILDAQGLMGQVIEVLPYTSRVLLVADSNHAIPVQVTRNGVRAIAVGSGQLNELKLIYVPDTADIKVGDQLVSSGLGSRYPKGYPLGDITQVSHDPGQPFAQVLARPSAYLDRSRYVLLVFSMESELPSITAVQEGEQ